MSGQRNTRWKDDYGILKFRWISLFGTLGIIVLVAAIGFPIYFLGKSYDKTACHNYAAKLGRETKFITYGWASWDCITRGNDGRWIPTDQLRSLK